MILKRISDDMLTLSRKNKLMVMAISLSLGLLLFLGEIGVRFFVENGDITPEVLRMRSVQYEPVVFARHAFKQEARIVNYPFGKKKDLVWEINEKGYRGQNFEVPKPKGLIRIMVFGESSVFDTKSTRGEDWPHRIEIKLKKTWVCELGSDQCRSNRAYGGGIRWAVIFRGFCFRTGLCSDL